MTIYVNNLVSEFIFFYQMILMVRILCSWFPDFQQTKIFHFLFVLTEPYLAFFRRFIPPLGMIDLSPMLAFLFLGLLRGMFS